MFWFGTSSWAGGLTRQKTEWGRVRRPRQRHSVFGQKRTKKIDNRQEFVLLSIFPFALTTPPHLYTMRQLHDTYD